jgi:hypothetical protein
MVGLQNGTANSYVWMGATTGAGFQFSDSGGNPLLIIESNGDVVIGTTSALGKLHVDQDSTTAAIPTLLLEQRDLSEEFIEFATTVGAGNPIDTAAVGTYYGKVRVMVTGVGYKYMELYNT